MNLHSFKEKLAKYTVFSFSDVRKIDPTFHKQQLSYWHAQGLVKKIRRGYYMFPETKLDTIELFRVSNRIYGNSYVSLESALSFYGLIPEGVFTVTAISTKNTAYFDTPITAFRYQHIKKDLFFGYELLPNGAKIASIEKVLLDYLYFHPEICDAADFQAWRFNSDEFLAQVNLTTLQAYADAYPKSVQTRLETVLHHIKNSAHA